jgi:Ca2+-transporting ATPase
MLGLGSPLTAIQLLWLNLVSDGAPALALGTEKGDPDLMDQKPRPSTEPIINKKMAIGVAIQTVVDTSTTLAAYVIGFLMVNGQTIDMIFNQQKDFTMAHTMAFVTLCLSELIRAYAARSERYSVFKIGFFSNKWMNLAVLASFLLVMVVVYVPFLNPIFNTQPLLLEEWAEVVPLFLIPFVAAELIKRFVFSRK